MTGATTDTTEAGVSAEEALRLLNSIKTGEWVKPSITGGDLAALAATMRPIDELSSAGLDWLVPYVQPLQDVLDGMAGNAAVIQSFTDAWQRAAAKVAEVRDQLARRAEAETSEWHGGAADRYRARAQELALALETAAHVAEATGLVARKMGEAVAEARKQVNDLLTDLVRRLISYAKQAVAVEGGVTPNVLAQCTSMIDSYRAPISAIERQLQQTLDSIEPPRLPVPPGPTTAEQVIQFVSTFLGAVGNALNPKTIVSAVARGWGAVRAIFGRRGGGANRQREVDRAYRERERQRQQEEQEAWQRYERQRYRGSDYTQGMEKIYGPPPKDGNTYVGHHNFPVKYGRKFEELGIDTSNPAWGSWVREGDHRGFSAQFERDWSSFFQNNPNATRADAFKFVRELGNKYGYKIPF
ncbi:MAG TPA: hypothetical protein VGR06_20010 [Actinophytocola sp.]|uniref:WXG100 family type VII secretion target n=1 Tax=Actinophytocola sp. TaxID=1872138 RepID=UPI002DF78C00|nr:hypothetical protein [Actinophytocola sp.]